jgi:rod shape-determining protein MreD
LKNPVTALKIPLRPGREYKSRLNREQSPLRMFAIPTASVMFGSMITTLPVIEGQALLPPMGLLILIAWRLMRPGLWPMWAGLPFGLFDDMFSGQPFGSAGLLWSLSMLAIELVDVRAMWRDHWQDWFIGGILIMLNLLGGLWFVGLAYTRPEAITLLPQILLSILIFPLVVRFCSWLDRIRLST